MAGSPQRRKRQRGSIEELPSGALRVSVYAGIDPVTGRRHYLKETVPPGPAASAEAEKVMRRLANQVDEQRHPRTSATVDQLLDRYLENLDVGRTTHRMYAKYLEKHVRPFIGRQKAGAIDADALDSLYAELRRCRIHCTDKRAVDHRTPHEHTCDERCRRHECQPLSASTIRQIHFVLNGAYGKGVRWRWVATNPVALATPPAARKPDPQPPSAEQTARLLNEAWADPDWGTLVWLAMATGGRRGELCALRWSHVDLVNGVLTFRRSIAQDGTHREEKDTKTHQQRRLTLDPETVAVLQEHKERAVERAAALDLDLGDETFVFSLDPDGTNHLVPSSVSQRYSRLAARIGIDTHLHNLRHYSATELIASGVDVRTVAGRLGHSGGGITTLRVYAAWMSEADQRAAGGLLGRMPARPEVVADPVERALGDPKTPRELLAADLRTDILTGKIPLGGHLPGLKQLAKERGVSTSTVHRAFELLREAGLIVGDPGERPTVLASLAAETSGRAAETDEVAAELAGTVPPDLAKLPAARQWLDLVVRHRGVVVSRLTTEVNRRSGAELRQVLAGVIRRSGGDAALINDYEMELRAAGDDELLTTFVAAR
ncbi:tyrosine-type recombinase/integrase [Pseudonocardia sp. T1-2H]|uniref:tyrosine-type recombinase/integrase n=1 Tax=Pseudonocardia sp. T1-2H TaxID=3128899 RepID=UPI0031015BB3